MIARIETLRRRWASPVADAHAEPRTGLAAVQGVRDHAAQLQRVAGILELAAQEDPVHGRAAGATAAVLRAEAAVELGRFDQDTTTVVNSVATASVATATVAEADAEAGSCADVDGGRVVVDYTDPGYDRLVRGLRVDDLEDAWSLV